MSISHDINAIIAEIEENDRGMRSLNPTTSTYHRLEQRNKILNGRLSELRSRPAETK